MKVEANSLKHTEEFRKLLNNYQPNSELINNIDDSKLVFMVGPTASGRNTVINILKGTDRYQYIVSDTTRSPRMNNGVMEQNGVEYWFKTEEQILEGLNNKEYLEAAIIHDQQVSGINLNEMKRAINSGKIAISEIEVAGAKNIHKYFPGLTYIFLLPPAFEDWMARLHGRGRLPEDEMQRRLNSANKEISIALDSDFYHFVINHDKEEAALAVDELANGRLPDRDKQQMGKNHAEQLIIDIRLYLNQ